MALPSSSSTGGVTGSRSVFIVTSKVAALPASSAAWYGSGNVTAMVRLSPGRIPSSCSAKPGMNPDPPISTSMSVPVPPGKATPSDVPA